MIKYNLEEAKKIITECKLNRKEYVFKNFFENDVTWGQILEEINDAWDYKDVLPDKKKSNIHNHIHYGERFDIIIEHTVEKTKIEQSQDFINATRYIYDRLDGHHLIFANLINGADTLYHDDISDNFQWMCLGSSHWSIKDQDGEREYILEAGDMIFIPSGVKHEVKPSIRASMNMNFNYFPN